MGSPGTVSVVHTSSGELMNGSFVPHPVLTATGMQNGQSKNPIRTGSPERGAGGGVVGERKRPRPRTHSIILSDSDGDASEDKPAMGWSRGHNNGEEKTERHIAPGVGPGSNNKFRILADEDRIMNNTPVRASRFETSNGAAVDNSPDELTVELDANEHESPLEYCTEEISEFGANGGKLTLWQFLLELLLSNKYRNLIRWTSKKGEFILLQAESVAKLWGLYKDRNHRMNYDKLSRALRYYYEKNIIRKVHGHKFVYQFIGLRNLIKMCQDATNNALPSRSFELIADCCSSPETKPNTDWDLPAGAALSLDEPSPCVYGQNDLQDVPSCTMATTPTIPNVSNHSCVIDGHGNMLYSQNRLTPTKSGTRGINHVTLDGLIERWPAGTLKEKMSTNVPTTRSTMKDHRSPQSEETGRMKDRHTDTPESTDLQFTASVDPNIDANPSSTSLSSLLYSLASFMHTGPWIPRLAEQNPLDLQPLNASPTSSHKADVISKQALNNFLLNPIPGPMWMTQLMNAGREPLKSFAFSPENDLTRPKLLRPDPYFSQIDLTSKSPIPFETCDNLNRFLRSQNRGFDESNISPYQSAAQTERISLETRADSDVRLISPDCHCSCHTKHHNKFIDWSIHKPHSTNDHVNIHTKNPTINTRNDLFLTDTEKDVFNSPSVQADPSKLLSNLPVNPVCEASPTQLHHQRHAINMQRLGEQLSRISRSHSHLLSNSSQAGTMNTTHPPRTSCIPTGLSSAPPPIARVQTTGSNETEYESTSKPGNSFECVSDSVPRIPSSSSTSSSSIPSGSLRNDEPCVWMPVPVTMLTSWIKLLSGMTSTGSALGVPTAAPGECPTHKDLRDFSLMEPELNDRSARIQSHVHPMSTNMELFPMVKTEPRDNDRFAGV